MWYIERIIPGITFMETGIRFKILSSEMQFFLKFFDVKSFCIMAFMMTFGIGLRASHLCPVVFIAVFYSGLGAALLLAGIAFTYHYFIYAAAGHDKRKEPKNAGNYGDIL